MAEKKLRTSPFIPDPDEKPGDNGLTYETDYDEIAIVDKVTKIGEGEHDFIIEKEVIHTKKPIQEVIDADKDSVGVENIIKMVLRTGDTSLLPVDKGDCNVDLVGAPETLMEVKQMGVDAQAVFGKLPADLVKGMDMKAFVDNMTQEQFDAFVAAMKSKLEPSSEKGGNDGQ